MKGDLYINEKDAWITWGVSLEDDSESKLLMPANNKEYASNKCRSQPGKQVFANNPQPEDRDLLLVVNFSAETKQEFLAKYRAFLVEINSGIITFRVTSIGEEYKFICEGFQELNYYERIGKLSIRFNEPNPKDRIYL